MAKEYLSVKTKLPDQKEHKFACATCAGETFHEVLTGVLEDGATEDINFSGEYWVIQCKGCKTLSFCHRSTTSEDLEYDEEGDLVPSITVKLYPSRLASRKMPSWTFELPHSVYRIYEETHSALCNNELLLAGVGIRAIVEAVCKEAGLKTGNLKTKIDALKAKGIVTQDGADVLHSLRFIGNVAAHENKAHTPDELGTAFEVVDHLLLGTYVIPRRAKKLPKK